MSASIRLSPDQLERLAKFLRELTRARHTFEVDPAAYGALDVDDRCGS